jgi:ESF2/ABP1 family protein
MTFIPWSIIKRTMPSSEEDNFYGQVSGSENEEFYSDTENKMEEDNENANTEGDDNIGSFDIDEMPIAKLKKPLISESDLKRFKKGKDRTGVVYISRIPPAMTPSNIRQYLSPFGNIGRVYLAPDDRKAAHLKKLSKKAKKALRPKSAFTEGWIEFLNKKDAKSAALALNGRPYGGRRGSRFREDLWCIRYLGSDFKWSTLTERISYENAVREQKMREEISHARRENKSFLGQVEKARVIKKIEEKKQGRIQRAAGESVNVGVKKEEISLEDVKRKFRQRKPIN